MKQFKVSVYKMTKLDDYEKGCLDDTHDHGKIDDFTCSDLNEVLESITKYYGKPSIFGDRLELSILENADGSIPRDFQESDWKKGNHKLWNADYSFYITEITSNVLTHNDLVKQFQTLEHIE